MSHTILHTPVCDLLGCRYPLVLAGMGGVARSELVAAVSSAGGFGFLGMVREPVRLIEAEVGRARAAGHRRFGVNLIPAATDPALLEQQLGCCIELAVPAVCLFWDLDAATVRRLRDAGILVVYQVGSAAEAVAAERAGAQVLIAQGVEAGGHVRGTKPLSETLPEVLAATSVPVLAAGGIADGLDVASVLALGAEAAVIGTALIATDESFAHDYHKQRLLEASAGDTVLTEAFHVNWPPGAPVRVLRSEVTAGRRGDPHAAESVVIGDEDGRPIRLFSTDSPLRSMSGEFAAMALYAGTGVGRVHDVVAAGERLRSIVQAAEDVLANTGVGSERIEMSSSVCYADEVGAEYMGLLGRAELLERLNGLVDSLRAALRQTLRDPAGVRWQRDCAHWAVRLARLVARRGGSPSRRDRADALPAGQTQEAVATEIEKHVRALLPLVADDCVRGPLEALVADLGAHAGTCAG